MKQHHIMENEIAGGLLVREDRHKKKKVLAAAMK
jgi:hypothetical protein